MRWTGIRWNRVETALFDLRHRTDTRGKAPVSELDPIGDNVVHGTGYQAVNERHLRRALTAIDLAPRSTFVDVGCGKGKALLVAARHPAIGHAIGVEFSGALCEVARRNASGFASRQPEAAPITVVHEDALRFPIGDQHDVVFLNNPFDRELTARFARVLERTLARRTRPLWLLYGNPSHADAIEEGGAFETHALLRNFGPGRDIVVYRALGA